jgi:hypothetical protein
MILNEAALSHGCFKVKVLAIKKWPVQKEGLKNLVKGLHSKTWAGFSSEATDGKAASSYYHRKLLLPTSPKVEVKGQKSSRQSYSCRKRLPTPHSLQLGSRPSRK